MGALLARVIPLHEAGPTSYASGQHVIGIVVLIKRAGSAVDALVLEANPGEASSSRASTDLTIDQALALTRGIVRERLETDQTRCHLTLVTPYGPFARLADGVEGLIHVTAPGGRKAPSVCSCRRAHMNRCPVGGRVRTRTYNRNQMMPALIYGPEEV